MIALHERLPLRTLSHMGTRCTGAGWRGKCPTALGGYDGCFACLVALSSGFKGGRGLGMLITLKRVLQDLTTGGRWIPMLCHYSVASFLSRDFVCAYRAFLFFCIRCVGFRCAIFLTWHPRSALGARGRRSQRAGASGA